MCILEPLIIENISYLLGQKFHEDLSLQKTNFGFGLPGEVIPYPCGQRGLFLLFQHLSSMIRLQARNIGRYRNGSFKGINRSIHAIRLPAGRDGDRAAARSFQRMFNKDFREGLRTGFPIALSAAPLARCSARLQSITA